MVAMWILALFVAVLAFSSAKLVLEDGDPTLAPTAAPSESPFSEDSGAPLKMIRFTTTQV